MLLAFSVAPSGGDDPSGSVHDAVAAAVEVVRRSGLPNRTDSMFTRIVDLGHGSFIRPAGI
ncbi:thiamine-binding protein [Brevibacterium ihuae]|uniref:thiamine-binding protein n=1 Tax=Brevibacterium ihuae TaxID=1631743 RepID=UPI000C781C9D